MMQNVVIIVLVIVAVVAMVLGGWISFADKDDSATMTIHKNEVKRDTEEAVKKGEELVKEAADEGRKLINQTEDATTSEEPADKVEKSRTEQPEVLETPR